MTRLIPLLALLAIPLQACGAASPAGKAPAAGAGCGFTSPPGLGPVAGRWLGGCRGGRADGPGVVRVATAGGPPLLWFGPMTAGQPGRGVISRGGDYYPQAGEDRAEAVRVFDAAAAGARAAARQLAAGRNAASARFYAAEAIKLERTLD